MPAVTFAKASASAALNSEVISFIAAACTGSPLKRGVEPKRGKFSTRNFRAWAATRGRDYVIPDDVKQFVEPGLVHRLILEPDLWMKRHAAEEILASIIQAVPVPVFDES